MPNLGFEDDYDNVKIAVTTFAYNNGEAIKLLRERGAAIKSENWEGVTKADEKINKIKME